MNVKVMVLDVDGTLTDGKIHMGSEGELFKSFNVRDGLAIARMVREGAIVPVIITGRTSRIVEARARELGIDRVEQGVEDKLLALDKVLKDMAASRDEVAYIGDDLNDLHCMRSVKAAGGIVACPANAAKEVQAVADFVLSCNGGEGAVREFIDKLEMRGAI